MHDHSLGGQAVLGTFHSGSKPFVTLPEANILYEGASHSACAFSLIEGLFACTQMFQQWNAGSFYQTHQERCITMSMCARSYTAFLLAPKPQDWQLWNRSTVKGDVHISV